MSLQTVCIDRFEHLSPRHQQYLMDHWNMVSALEMHQLLASGDIWERAAAANFTVGEIYTALAAYFDEAARQAVEEEPAVISYALDHDFCSKLMYMAKRGLSFRKGELPV